MVRFFFASLLFTGVLASCAPRQQAVVGVTVTPVLIKLSESAARGGILTIQGRYLGGPSTGRVRRDRAEWQGRAAWSSLGATQLTAQGTSP